jgi:hypothetical protein
MSNAPVTAPSTEAATSPNKPGLASALRFATELVAWVATPWALAGVSPVLSVASVLLLIGLPTIFSTPGDKPKVIVAAPGYVTVALVVVEMAAAVISASLVWPPVAAVPVCMLVAVSVVTELPRWRWLLRHR